MSNIVKKGIIFGGAALFVLLLVVATAYGWGADQPLQQRANTDHHRHHRVHHGGYYVPFYTSYGRRGSSRGAGGFRGGK